MNAENIASLRKALESSLQKQIILDSKVDDSLIGGFILRVSDNQIDASLRTGLSVIRKNLVN